MGGAPVVQIFKIFYIHKNIKHTKIYVYNTLYNTLKKWDSFKRYLKYLFDN